MAPRRAHPAPILPRRSSALGTARSVRVPAALRSAAVSPCRCPSAHSPPPPRRLAPQVSALVASASKPVYNTTGVVAPAGFKTRTKKAASALRKEAKAKAAKAAKAD